MVIDVGFQGKFGFEKDNCQSTQTFVVIFHLLSILFAYTVEHSSRFRDIGVNSTLIQIQGGMSVIRVSRDFESAMGARVMCSKEFAVFW